MFSWFFHIEAPHVMPLSLHAMCNNNIVILNHDVMNLNYMCMGLDYQENVMSKSMFVKKNTFYMAQSEIKLPILNN